MTNTWSLPWLLVFQSACIIGTWPTPEARDQDAAPSEQGTAMAPELCDNLDNDADGAVDEGCACATDVRGCIGVELGQCGLGVQRCQDGVWSSCTDIGPPWNARQAPRVTISQVVPETLQRGGTEIITVVAVATLPCPGIHAQRMAVVLEALRPTMRVKSMARDDGTAPDSVAWDNTFAATLRNVFGPGVEEQTLTLRVTAAVGGVDVSDSVAVDLEEP